MGFGIWSMHYIGMLAFRLPVPVQYDWPTVLLSLLAAILASAFALIVVSRKTMGWMRAVLASIFMGGGIATMHYTGMNAMRLPAMCSWSAPLVTLSIVLAVVISLVALWLTFHFREENRFWSWRKALSAVVMGAAIPIMHYTGMAAATFTPSTLDPEQLNHAVSVSSLTVAGISTVTFIVLGLVLLASLGIDQAVPQTPIVVLTVTDEQELAVQTLNEGAQDYLPKAGINGALIWRALRYAIERERIQMKLMNLALIDDLTGLHNRRGFLALGESYVRLANRSGMPYLIAFIDLDGLKRINDTFGHQEGNRTLVEAAGILKDSCRQSDILARLGGDEFALLIADVSED